MDYRTCKDGKGAGGRMLGACVRPFCLIGRRPPGAPRNRGFTLIELVTVIVILGALAAIAVPKFIDLRSNAYQAVVAATAGALGTAVQMANIQCLVSNWAGKDNLPGYAAGNVDFNSGCFPSGTGGANGIGNNDNRCVAVWEAILLAAPTAATNASADYRAAANSNICTFTFQLDTGVARAFDYNSLSGGVAIVSNP